MPTATGDRNAPCHPDPRDDDAAHLDPTRKAIDRTTADPPRRRCPCCGHVATTDAGACPRCGGEARALADTPQTLPAGRGLWPADLLRGFKTLTLAGLQVLHHRAFVGRIGVPIAGNAVGVIVLAVGLGMLWAPVADLFAAEWPLLDGWRAANTTAGPARLLLATAWTLWPVWLEAVTGALVEPLAATAEVAIGGPGMQAAAPSVPGALTERLQRRARVVTFQLLLLPAAWLLALVPYVGLPLVFVATAAVAGGLWTELPAERRGRSHREHLADLRRNWPLVLGYGMALQLLLLVPIANFVVLAPAAAVGASVLYFRFDKV
ncbi:MAG: EI24 domain-containing protein [Planctomycetota bacterium]